MASADQYAQWIVANADKKGTPDFETVAHAYQIAKASESQPSNPAANEGATLQLGPIDTHILIPDAVNNTLAGIGKSAYDAARGIGELTGFVSRADVDQANKLDAPLMATKAGMLGDVAGNIGMALAPGGALKVAAQGAKMLPAAARLLGYAGDALVAPSTATQGAVGGALLGAAAPVGTDQSRGLNAIVGAATGGVGSAVANKLAAALGPRAATLTPEQQSLVAKALDMGYALNPSQMTGKTWQRNLEAAMAQNPATSGTMQARAAANQAVTDNLVENALVRAGGAIDQPSAQAAAMSGFSQGLAAEKGRVGGAYDALLNGVDVPLEQMRPALEQLRAKQMALPADVQGGVAELDTLLGSPGYAAKQGKAFVKPSVEPHTDDIATAIRKFGGLNPDDERIGATVAQTFPFNPDPKLGPVWARPIAGQQSQIGGIDRGLSLDNMAQLLAGAGYISDRNALDEVLDKLSMQSSGYPQYSAFFDHEAANRAADPLASAIEGLNARLDAKIAPAPLSPGYLRNNPTVPAQVAQDMRSQYGTLEKNAFTAGRAQARQTLGGIQDAVDAAIASAVPADKAGQFAALNQRYGLVKAVEKMEPSNQQAFLGALYRGDPDKFYTFLGLSDDAHFQQVARGFLSNLVEGATNPATKSVNAAALGRAVNRANPEAMRVLGGAPGQTLADVGAVGRNLLPDIPNSGTAQRWLYNSLLSGAGLFGGAYGGDEFGGTPGGVAGSIAGSFLMPKAVQAAYLSKALRPLLTSGVAGREALASPMARALVQRMGVALPMAGLGGLYATQ